MACPVGAYGRALKSLTDKGMSEADAIKNLKKSSKFGDLVQTGITDGSITQKEINGLLTTTDKEIKEKTASILIETKTPDQLLAIKPQLTDSGAWKQIESATGFEAWTKLPGKFDWNKANDDAYLQAFIMAGDKDALKIKDYVKSEAKKGNSTPLVRFVGDMAKASVDNAKKIVNDDIELKQAYDGFFSDYKNIAHEDIVVDATYGTMKWKDHLGAFHDFDVVDSAGRVWVESENNGIGGYVDAIPSEYKAKQGYDTATFTLDKAKYAKEIVLEGEGKTVDEQLQLMVNKGLLTKDGQADLTNKDWYSCVGTLCNPSPEESGGGGGGGGGDGGGSSGSVKEGKDTEALYIECNVANAVVIDKGNGQELGKVNTTITMKKGSYTIQVKANGYKTRELPVTIGSYPVAKTINLTKIGPSISTFILGIGGIQNLTKSKYFYLYCIYMMRITSAYTWKQLADSVDSVQGSALPLIINKEDVLYVYYLVNGDLATAQALVDTGKVTLLDAEGGEIKETEENEIGTTGGI